MADQELGNPFGLNIPQGGNVPGTYDNPNLTSLAKMRAALQDADDTLYSDENLDAMTYNDMVYAIKINDIVELPTPASPPE